MKLLDVTEFHSPVGGGVTTYLEAKARWLSDHSDIEHVIVVSSRHNAVETWHGSRVYHVSGPPVPASPGFYFLLAPGRLRDIMQLERPDIIEVGSPFLAPWMVRYAIRGLEPALMGYFHDDVRSVWVDHGLAKAPRLVRKVAGAIIVGYMARVYGRLDHTIAPSTAAAAALMQLGISKVSTIPLGVDTELFHPRQRDRAWKARVGASEDTPVALYVGRLSREKELDGLLDALPHLHAEHGLKLVVIGEGHMRARLETLARARPDQLAVLPFESDRSKLAQAYASAVFFFVPCPYETFGLATIEAMASGLPIVGADAGGLRDMLRAAEWGATFAPKSPDAIRAAVRQILHAGCKRLGVKAREAAVEHFGWNRTFERQTELYRQVNAGDSRLQIADCRLQI